MVAVACSGKQPGTTGPNASAEGGMESGVHCSTLWAHEYSPPQASPYLDASAFHVKRCRPGWSGGHSHVRWVGRQPLGWLSRCESSRARVPRGATARCFVSGMRGRGIRPLAVSVVASAGRKSGSRP